MKETEFELRAWLQPLPNGQPPRKLSALGVRLSRLTLPYMELDLSYDNDRNDWGLFALACFRASIVGHAAAIFSEDFPLQTIHDAINFLPDEEGSPCVSTLKFGLKALTQTDTSFEQLIHALASCGEVSDPLLEVTYGLNSYVDRLGESVAEVLSVILSYDGSFHNSHADQFLNELEEISTSASWAFWRDWYTSFQDERPFSWELQRRVATEIPDAIWDAGPAAVAAVIERIRSRYELEQEVARLKEQLAAAERTPTAALIGDNGGPPLEDAAARALQTDLALIWKQVEELEEEIAKPSPSPSLLEKIAKTLWEISLRMAAYCGSVADGMIREGTKELAKAGAKWTARATAVTVTAQTEGVQSVAKALWAFVKALQ